MYDRVLSEKTKNVFHTIAHHDFLNPFYLSGGTALALQLNHRESEDLDFFTKEKFDEQALQITLSQFGILQNLELNTGTLNCYMNDVKIQFLYYPYDLLVQPPIWEGVSISSLIDIACTKIITISMRGHKKDFIDLFFLLKEFRLPYIFQQLEIKYNSIHYNKEHLVKSLLYFVDADNQPMPRVFQPLSWDEVKEEITIQVKKYPIFE